MNNRIDNLLGQTFNYLTVMAFDGLKGKTKRSYWLCKCTCGNFKSVSGSSLKNGNVKSCGCFRIARMAKLNFEDLTGKVYARLTVRKIDKTIHGKIYWVCDCICGNIVSARSSALNSGNIKSCGCFQKESARDNHLTHGMYGTRFYGIWSGIKERCVNVTCRDYPFYGGKLCQSWFEFINFKEDLYDSYLKHVEEFGEKETTLDRFPNNHGNYELGNVRWATYKEQAGNRRTSFNSENPDEHRDWKRRLGNRLVASIRYDLKTSPELEKYLGCSLQEFKKYIESLWLPSMTWENRGKGLGKWEFDHIIGCNNFDLSKEADRYKCWNHTNIKPMWWADHIYKSTIRLSEITA
jgi:hypothetical protein